MIRQIIEAYYNKGYKVASPVMTAAEDGTGVLAGLTEEETAVFHRGRNAKSGTSAKNASIVDYRKATGFEAVMGYLYLQGDLDRAVMLIKKALDTIGLEL